MLNESSRSDPTLGSIYFAPFPGLAYFSLLQKALMDKGYSVAGGWKFPRRGTIVGKPLSAVHIHMLDMLFFRPTFNPTRALWFFNVFCPFLKLRRIKLVWTCHELQAHEFDSKGVSRTLAHSMIRAADTVICHSTALLDAVRRESPAMPLEKLKFIPHGTLSPYYDNLEAQSHANTSKNFILSSLGYMRPNKGNDLILRAFREYKDPGARLVMIGLCKDEEYKRVLEELSHDDLRIDIQFRALSEKEMIEKHMESDAIVFGFRDCPTSGSLITAMSLGKPVVAPFIGHVKDLVSDDSGWLYSPAASHEALTEAIRRTAESRSIARKKGAAARARIDQDDWAFIADELIEIYGGLQRRDKGLRT